MDRRTFLSLNMFDRIRTDGDQREWVVAIGCHRATCTVYPMGGGESKQITTEDAPAWTLVSRGS